MKLHLASGNAHKVQEFQSLAQASGLAGLEIVSARAVGGMPPVVEDTGTFEGNALKKARALHAQVGEASWVLSDDSGVCVEALGGLPGVESAYYAGPQADPAANLAKLVSVMRGVPDLNRRAFFVCVLCLVGPGGLVHQVEGRCEGVLLHEPRGGAGFGYDPLFVPDGYLQSFAELGEAEKNQLSHRSRAWKKLVGWLAAAYQKK